MITQTLLVALKKFAKLERSAVAVNNEGSILINNQNALGGFGTLLVRLGVVSRLQVE